MATLLLQKPLGSLVTHPPPNVATPKRRKALVHSETSSKSPSEHVHPLVTLEPTPPHPSQCTPHFHFTNSISNGAMRWNPLSEQVLSSVDTISDASDRKISLPFSIHGAQLQASRAPVQLDQQAARPITDTSRVGFNTTLSATPLSGMAASLKAGVKLLTQADQGKFSAAAAAATGFSATHTLSSSSSSSSSSLHHICSTKQRAMARDKKRVSMTVGGKRNPPAQLTSQTASHGVHQARASRLLGSNREAQMDDVQNGLASIDEELEEERESLLSKESSVIGMFFQNTRASLLTAEEEAWLAQMSKDCVRLKVLHQELLQKLGQNVTDSHMAKALGMDEASYLRRETLCCSAQKMLMGKNRLLVISIAKKYKGRGVSFPDLVAIGMEGLLKGIQRFMPEKGFRLSTYATWWIRASLGRATQEQCSIIRAPAGVMDEKSKVGRAQRAISATQEGEATCKQLSKASGLSEDKVRHYLMVQRRGEVKSLEAPANGENSQATGSLGDTIEQEILSEHGGEFAELGLTDSGKDILQQQLEAIFATLSPRERTVAEMRFGLDANKSKTCSEAAVVLGVSRARVNQIERIILDKIKKDPETSAMLQELWKVVVENDQTFASIRSSRAFIKSK